MGAPTVRELLNRLRWSDGAGGAAVEVEYVTRTGAGERLETFALSEVVAILPRGVTLSGDTFIPYHRLRLVRRDGEPLWRARSRRCDDEG